MSDTVEPIDPGAATSTLRMRAMIDDAQIERLRIGLSAMFYDLMVMGRTVEPSKEKLAALEARWTAGMARRAMAMRLITWLGLAGLALSLVFAATGGIFWRGHRLDLAFAVFFLVSLGMLIPLRRLQRLNPVILYRGQRPWRGLWQMLANAITSRTLRTARKLTPFDAQYDFTEGTVTYTRITASGASVIWQRPLEGWRISGPGFTFLLKRRGSMQGILIMHEPCVRFDELLKRHGVQDLPWAGQARADGPTVVGPSYGA